MKLVEIELNFLYRKTHVDLYLKLSNEHLLHVNEVLLRFGNILVKRDF